MGVLVVRLRAAANDLDGGGGNRLLVERLRFIPEIRVVRKTQRGKVVRS
jgi:hypothetical protein